MNRLRALISLARRVVNRAPAPFAARVTDTARTVRNRRRDRSRAAHDDDGAYFDAVVERAIAEGGRS